MSYRFKFYHAYSLRFRTRMYDFISFCNYLSLSDEGVLLYERTARTPIKSDNTSLRREYKRSRPSKLVHDKFVQSQRSIQSYTSTLQSKSSFKITKQEVESTIHKKMLTLNKKAKQKKDEKTIRYSFKFSSDSE